MARIKSQIRRYTQLANLCENIDRIYRVDDLEVDDMRRKVMVGEKEVYLTPIEYKILRLLVKEKAIRLWPRKLIGEGHYLAVLEKAGRTAEGYQGFCRFGTEQGIEEKECKEFLELKQEYLQTDLEGIYIKFGEQLYLAPEGLTFLTQIKGSSCWIAFGNDEKEPF